MRLIESPKLCEFHRRGVIDAGEAVTSMLHDLSHCQSEFAAEQCVARLPQEFHSELVRQVKHWLSLEHPGNLFVFVPNIPTDDELLEMDKRFRFVWHFNIGLLGKSDGSTRLSNRSVRNAKKQVVGNPGIRDN